MNKDWLKKNALLLRRKSKNFIILCKDLTITLAVKVVYPTVYAHKPIQNNKIVFDNYMGKGFGCNPKYVAEKLLELGDGKYDLVWLISSEDKNRSEIPPQIRTVLYGSLRSIYEYATAKIWVSNYHKVAYVRKGLRKREGQYFIQMWHGSLGIKKIEKDVPALTRKKRWLACAIKSSRMTDYWISNGDYGTFEYKSGFWDVKDEAVLTYGHPRNDLFFSAERMRRAREKVNAIYKLNGKKLLLYAPTFREDYRTDCYRIDFSRLKDHLQRKFGGDWVILLRMHPRIRDRVGEILPSDRNLVDVTRYVDIQELLAAADCLITDYSCCSFDYMLTRRPVFLYATDLHEYDMERGFYYPLETTPFPLAHDNKELMRKIEEFDKDDYFTRVDSFLREKGCIEDGHASERVAGLIERLAWAEK